MYCKAHLQSTYFDVINSFLSFFRVFWYALKNNPLKIIPTLSSTRSLIPKYLHLKLGRGLKRQTSISHIMPVFLRARVFFKYSVTWRYSSSRTGLPSGSHGSWRNEKYQSVSSVPYLLHLGAIEFIGLHIGLQRKLLIYVNFYWT